MIKILAIDDHQDNLISLKAIIQDAFPLAILYTALSGPEGIEIAMTNEPDVILLDVVMPGMDGFEVCRRFKADERFSSIPIIFLTALGGDAKSRLKALEIGGEAFLSKPIDEAELTAQIKAMIIIKKHYLRQKNEKEYLTSLIAERTQELEEELKERKQAQELLRQSNDLYNSLLQTIPYGMDIVDENGNILFLSDNLKSIVGDNSFGKKCWCLYRDDKMQCDTCPLRKGITIGETSINESQGVLGGKTFEISHTGMMYKGRKAMLEIFMDITEKKERESKIRLLAHSLESITECVSVTDDKNIIKYVNKSFQNTYGYTVDELIGQSINILRDPASEFDHVRDVLAGTIDGGWRGELMNRKKDGTLFPILLSTSVIKDDYNQPIALVGVAMDITEMRRDRLALLEAKEQAEENNNLKTAFLNNMSHEIRTPMNHIMGFASLMGEADDADKNTFAEIILKSSNQLLSLIENVILLSRLQSEKSLLEIQEFYPAELIDSVINNCVFGQPTLCNTLISTVPKELQNISIIADIEKIKLILTNLTSNAIKYTFQGTIELGMKVEANHMTFFVKDNGIGIPSREQQKIFESFYRGENVVSLVIGGAGLGLSIVKELVNAMDGTIEVESELEKGSLFSVTIPFQYSSDSDLVSGNPLKKQQMSELSILIADDEMINYRYLQILLKKSVKMMDHARNGKEAIDMARNKPYDLILMDLKMPTMDGFEATKAFKKDYPETPIIVLTAYATSDVLEEARLAGCDDFIAKPVKKEVLFDVIRKYCRK